MTPVAFASFNKQGDITRTVKNADAWSKTALFTADQVAEAVRAEREACADLMEAQHTWITNVAASTLIRSRA
jgi:hypothetical protein